MKTQYFNFGEVYMTNRVEINLSMQEVFQLLEVHGQLKKGELSDEDYQENWYALRQGERIVSRFFLNGASYYVITEADRSYTTIMGVEEY